ncbi:MAG: hypothetical protein ABR526_06565 [Chthoniobacterales bacterium]
MKFRFLLPLLLVACATFAQDVPTADETARFLAGLPVSGPLAALMETSAWQEHARALEDAWAKKESRQIGPIRDWMLANAPEYFHSSNTAYYMFGGPDFLYANVFFPSASTYILAGLEPVGQVPDLTRMPPAMVEPELAALRASMNSILRFQYFITKDMRAELGRQNVGGTLPILYVFLARLGYNIVDVARVTSPADGVKIDFTDGESRQTLYYFKTDLSGGGNSAFLKWCAARGPGLSLLKAASYLMHTDGFGGVRNFLLEHSKVIVQDDSGIPLRGFPKNWRVQTFGRYVPHGDEFAKYNQPDLAAICADNPELGFPFGYHWQKNRGLLMLATPGGGGDQQRALPPVMKALPVEPEQQAQKPRVRE